MFEFLYPTSKIGVTYFYLFWSSIFVAIHMVWDWKSPNTPRFHILNLKSKINVLFSATTFCSSVLILLSLINRDLFQILGNVTVPLFLAGASGILLTIPEICPYKLPPNDDDDDDDDPRSNIRPIDTEKAA